MALGKDLELGPIDDVCDMEFGRQRRDSFARIDDDRTRLDPVAAVVGCCHDLMRWRWLAFGSALPEAQRTNFENRYASPFVHWSCDR